MVVNVYNMVSATLLPVLLQTVSIDQINQHTFQLPRFCRDSPGFWYTVPVSRIESICPGFKISHQKMFLIHIIFHQQCKNVRK